MGIAKKISIGIGIVFVIFVAVAAIDNHFLTQKSQLLDEIIAECYEKYPTQTEEFRDCRDGAQEKWSEMISDWPCIFLCPQQLKEDFERTGNATDYQFNPEVFCTEKTKSLYYDYLDMAELYDEKAKEHCNYED